MASRKYNPEEALDRIKLMMEYDSSKTLSENKISIEEQSYVTSPAAIGTGVGGAAAGALAGATIGSVVPIVGTAIGAVAGLGLGALANWWKNKDLGKKGFEEVISVCKTQANKNLIPGELDDQKIRNIAYTIQDAKGRWNDDEDAIEDALSEIPTISDFCKVDKRIPGGLLEFLDGLTDNTKEWERFTRPIQGMVEDELLKQAPFSEDFWKQKFPCIYSTPGAVGGIKKDNKNIAYLVIIGNNAKYRLYQTGDIYHIQNDDKRGTLKCNNNQIVLGENVNLKKLLEQFDDSSLVDNSSSGGGNQNSSGGGNQNSSGGGNQNSSGGGNQNSSGGGNQNSSGGGNQNSSGGGNQNTPPPKPPRPPRRKPTPRDFGDNTNTLRISATGGASTGYLKDGSY